SAEVSGEGAGPGRKGAIGMVRTMVRKMLRTVGSAPVARPGDGAILSWRPADVCRHLSCATGMERPALCLRLVPVPDRVSGLRECRIDGCIRPGASLAAAGCGMSKRSDRQAK